MNLLQRINPKTKEVLSETVSMKDVYDEFNGIVTKKFGIKEFKSRPVKKKYAFEKPGVPCEAEYLEVLYSVSKRSPAEEMRPRGVIWSS